MRLIVFYHLLKSALYDRQGFQVYIFMKYSRVKPFSGFITKDPYLFCVSGQGWVVNIFLIDGIEFSKKNLPKN